MTIEYRAVRFANEGYRVGSDGSVWSRKNARWGLRADYVQMKTNPDSGGYQTLKLMVGRKGVTFRVNVIVLRAFIGDAIEGHESCHNNGDPWDCRLTNLRWDTRRANIADAQRHGTMRVAKHGD